MKTILFLASRIPYPVTNGRDKTLVEYLSFFKEQDVNLVFCYFGKERAESKLVKSLEQNIGVKFQKVVFFPLPKLQSVIGKMFVSSFLLQKKSMQESLFYSQKIKKELKGITDEYKPDIIFCDMLRTAQYFSEYDNLHTLKVFDMDDILSERYKYLLQHDDNNILGNFSKNLPNIVNVIANSVLKKLILNLEAKLVRKREILLTHKFDKVILVSPNEAEKLKKLIKDKSNPQKVHFLYPSAGIGNSPIVEKKEEFSISFMGLLNVPHNEYALIHFFEEVLPELLKKIPQLKMYVIGGGAARKLLNYQELYPKNVEFTGYVKDYTIVLSKTRVFVAPINFGTGIKLKILDAMSLGLPVVTTNMGAEGLKVIDNIDLFIRDDSKGFINGIIDLLNSDELAEDIGNNALRYVKNHHDFNTLKDHFLDILNIKSQF